MKVIIAGAGSSGFQMAKALSLEGQDVAIVDPDPDVIRDVGNRLDALAIRGSATNLADLAEASIDECDFFIAMTGSDEINMIACAQVSAEFPQIHTIAQVRNQEYEQSKLGHAFARGITSFINPETTALVSLLNSLAYGALSDVIAFGSIDLQIRSITLPSDSLLNCKSLSTIQRELGGHFLIPLIARGDSYIIPSGDTIVHAGEQIFVAASDSHFAPILKATGKKATLLKHILVLGGGRLPSMTAGFLSGAPDMQWLTTEFPGLRQLFGSCRVRMIEENYELCRKLSKLYPDVTVINGDFSDEHLFEEEHLEETDVIICCGENEERNILSGLYAKQQGISRAITLVHSHNYLDIARKLSIDVPLSMKSALSSSILRIIRKGSIKNVQSIGNGSIEIIEFEIPEQARIVGRALKKSGFPPQTLVLAIQRASLTFTPNGDTEMQPGDRVIILTHKENSHKIQELMQVDA